MNVAMKWRADIAGLRAVAVLPILLFHAGVSQLPGGFVGVDIFFVISGYLITSIIIKELDEGSFSLMEFYRRRVARIVPALLAVLMVTLIGGVLFMLPPELDGLVPSIASAAIFGSNFYFLFSADYFGAAAETLPLLHTWSLAVEEQFYIFVPILLIAISRWKPRNAKLVVLLACIASFMLALAFARIKPEAAFYLMPTRAWELGIGSLIALGAFPVFSSVIVRNILACVGLVLIVVAVLGVESGPAFPAPLALLPCLGAALLIAYGKDAPTARILSVAPLRFIGDISYSLYLWHWPIITFYRLQTGVDLDWVETVALVASCGLIAYASYRWIERPWLSRLRGSVRENTLSAAPGLRKRSASKVVAGGLIAQLIVCSASFAAPAMASITSSWPDDVLYLASSVQYRETLDYSHQYRRGVCFFGQSTSQDYDWSCLTPSRTKPNMVIVGDSHAAQYWRALSERFSSYHVIQATNSGCRPLLGTEGDKICTDVVGHVFEHMIDNQEVEAVVLAGRWRQDEVAGLVDTVKYLRGRNIRVTVIGPVVEYDLDFPLVMARAALAGDLKQVDKHRISSRRDLDDVMALSLSSAGATYVSVYRLECPGPGECTLLDSRRSAPYHFDYGHLTLEASRELVARMPAP